jgi:hypothetical protein
VPLRNPNELTLMVHSFSFRSENLVELKKWSP